MDLQLSDVLDGLGYLLRGAAATVTFVAIPTLWILRGTLDMLRLAARAGSSVSLWILSIVLSPFIIPWRVMVWFWEMLLGVYDEIEPFIPYLVAMAIIGFLAGLAVATLTDCIVMQLRSWIPFLRPQRHHPHRQGSPQHMAQLRPQAQAELVTAPGARHRLAFTQSKDSISRRREHNYHRGAATSPSLGSSYPSKGADWEAAWGNSTGTEPGWSSASPAKKILRRRTPPPGVAVDDTIHEELSTEEEKDGSIGLGEPDL